jgi:hypothetical protein
MPDASIVVTMDDKYSDAVKKMSSVTKSFSKDIDQLEDVLYALNKNKISLKMDLSKAKSELEAAEKQFEQTQSAADGLKAELAQANYDNIVRNLETVTQAAGKAENAISKAGNQGRNADAQTAKTMMTTVAASGIGQMLRDVTMNMGTAVAGSMFGEAGGTIASNMLSSGATGAIAGTAILGPGVGTAIGTVVGAALGGLNGLFQNFEKKDDAYKSWYQGVYENAGSETDRMLTAGRSAVQETLGQPEAELNAVQGTLDAAGGEGYYAERNQGIADQIAAYGGELGEALAEANRAIGAGRAAMENLADSYTQEALSAVLTGSEMTLQWSDDNTQRLQELGTLYQEAMADYEAGNAEAGALVETYVEEARALAEAQYDSSEAAMGVAEAERDLITSINENTAALRGWRGEYDINQALTKGQAVSLLPGDKDSNVDSGNRLTALDSGIVNISTQAPRLQDVSIDYVPYQNLPEVPVLTATEVKNEQRSPAITITGNSFSIREEADVDRVANALLQKIELAERRG